MVTIEQIKEEISIISALEYYTAIKIPNPNRRSISTKCPFHADGKPSFVIYPQTSTFKCFTGCNDGRVGDVIDVVRLAKGVNHKEAIQTLVKDFQLSTTGVEAEKYRSKRKKREAEQKFNDLLDKRMIEQADFLNAMLRTINMKLASIQNIEDLDKLGHFYHLKIQAEYWIDCLNDEDDHVKIGAFKEIERFRKVGDSSERNNSRNSNE